MGIVLIYFLGKDICNRFAGLFAAISLAFNYEYLTYSNRVLIDVPLSTLILGCMWCSYHYLRADRHQSAWGLGVCATASVAIGLKWTGLVLLPIIACYYAVLRTRRKNSLPTVREMVWLVLPVLASVGVWLISNRVALGSWLPDLSAVRGLFFIREPLFYFSHLQAMNILYVYVFFLLGVLSLLLVDARVGWLLTVWPLVLLTTFSLAAEKEIRYVLPALPAVLLISGLGAYTAINQLCRRRMAVGLVQVVVLSGLVIFQQQAYAHASRVIQDEMNRYVGYKQIGQLIAQRVDRYAVIYAGSPRLIRLYSGINYVEYGGRLKALPPTKEQFEEMLARGGDALLEVDVWDFAQPKWIFPLTEKRLQYLITEVLQNGLT